MAKILLANKAFGKNQIWEKKISRRIIRNMGTAGSKSDDTQSVAWRAINCKRQVYCNKVAMRWRKESAHLKISTKGVAVRCWRVF